MSVGRPVILFRLDADGVIASNQGKLLGGFGVATPETAGRSIFDVLIDTNGLHDVFRRALAGDRFSYRAHDGVRWFETHFEPLFRDGELAGTIGITCDVTDEVHAHKRLLESEHRYRLLVDTASEGIVTTDRDYNISFVNNRMCEILDLTVDELLGRRAYSFVHPDDQALVSEDEFQLWGHRPQQFELHFANRSGERVPTLCSSRPMRDKRGAFMGIFGMVADISERSATEALRQQHAEDVERAERSEQQRLSRALHDGPIQQLAAVNLKLGALRSVNQDRAMSDDLAAIESEISDAVRSLRLVMFDIEPCDPSDVIGAIRSCATVLFTNTNVAVQVRGDLPVLEPPVANTMYRIVREALVNALKHSEASKVTVTLGRHLEGIWVSVLDNGVGLGHKPNNSGSFGLRSVLNRALEMGGLASVEPAPSAGVAVYAWLPNTALPA